MIAYGCYWSNMDDTYLWEKVLKRIGSHRLPKFILDSGFWYKIHLYPALLCFYTAGVSLISRGLFEPFGRLVNAELKSPNESEHKAVIKLTPRNLFYNNTTNYSNWQRYQQNQFPVHDWVLNQLNDIFSGLIPDRGELLFLFDKLCLILSIAYLHNTYTPQNPTASLWGAIGPYVKRPNNTAKILDEISKSATLLGEESPYVKAKFFGLNVKICQERIGQFKGLYNENREQLGVQYII